MESKVQSTVLDLFRDRSFPEQAAQPPSEPRFVAACPYFQCLKFGVQTRTRLNTVTASSLALRMGGNGVIPLHAHFLSGQHSLATGNCLLCCTHFIDALTPPLAEFRVDRRQVGSSPGPKIICLNEVRDPPGIRFWSATSMRDLAI
jgi:hypothetical protein